MEPRKIADKKDRNGNVIEKGDVFVETLHRQPVPKGRHNRTLVLPSAAVDMLLERCKRTMWRRLDDPVFCSSKGTLLWPNNQRTRPRAALKGTKFEGVTPHTLRRTVGTLLSHEAGLDVCRDVLGHSDPSVTFQAYTAARTVAPDVRHLLDRFFVDDEEAVPEVVQHLG